MFDFSEINLKMSDIDIHFESNLMFGSQTNHDVGTNIITDGVTNNTPNHIVKLFSNTIDDCTTLADNLIYHAINSSPYYTCLLNVQEQIKGELIYEIQFFTQCKKTITDKSHGQNYIFISNKNLKTNELINVAIFTWSLHYPKETFFVMLQKLTSKLSLVYNLTRYNRCTNIDEESKNQIRHHINNIKDMYYKLIYANFNLLIDNFIGLSRERDSHLTKCHSFLLEYRRVLDETNSKIKVQIIDDLIVYSMMNPNY